MIRALSLAILFIGLMGCSSGFQKVTASPEQIRALGSSLAILSIDESSFALAKIDGMDAKAGVLNSTLKIGDALEQELIAVLGRAGIQAQVVAVSRDPGGGLVGAVPSGIGPYLNINILQSGYRSSRGRGYAQVYVAYRVADGSGTIIDQGLINCGPPFDQGPMLDRRPVFNTSNIDSKPGIAWNSLDSVPSADIDAGLQECVVEVAGHLGSVLGHGA